MSLVEPCMVKASPEVTRQGWYMSENADVAVFDLTWAAEYLLAGEVLSWPRGLNRYAKDKTGEETLSKAMRLPMRASPAYIVTIVSKCFHPPLSRKSRLKLQHKIDISLTDKRFIARGVFMDLRTLEGAWELGC